MCWSGDGWSAAELRHEESKHLASLRNTIHPAIRTNFSRLFEQVRSEVELMNRDTQKYRVEGATFDAEGEFEAGEGRVLNRNTLSKNAEDSSYLAQRRSAIAHASVFPISKPCSRRASERASEYMTVRLGMTVPPIQCVSQTFDALQNPHSPDTLLLESCDQALALIPEFLLGSASVPPHPLFHRHLPLRAGQALLLQRLDAVDLSVGILMERLGLWGEEKRGIDVDGLPRGARAYSSVDHAAFARALGYVPTGSFRSRRR